MVTELADKVRGRLVGAVPGGATVRQQPLRRALVEGSDVELVDHEHAVRPDDLGEACERGRQWLDVVEGEHGDRRVEGRRRRAKLAEGDALDSRRARSRVDRVHVVAAAA